jgi:hypothetical protein
MRRIVCGRTSSSAPRRASSRSSMRRGQRGRLL